MHCVRDLVLVDDDDLYREVLSADLADRGFVVSSFADGPSLLDALDSGIVPHVALLDWTMPGISGVDLLRAIRARRKELPVIFLTGHAMVERGLQALDLGDVDFVDKACGVDVLAHRIRVVVEAHRLPTCGAPSSDPD